MADFVLRFDLCPRVQIATPDPLGGCGEAAHRSNNRGPQRKCEQAAQQHRRGAANQDCPLR
jgi:hypothetical protein